MVILHNQTHAVALKPFVSIAVVEDLEEPLHQSVAARINGGEVADIVEGVGTVAASTTGNLDLAEDVVAAFEDGHLHLRTAFLEVDGEKESCCAASNDGGLQIDS